MYLKRVSVVAILTASILVGCGSQSAEAGPEKKYVVWGEVVQINGQSVPCVIVDSKYGNQAGVGISCNWAASHP
jgi:hypothetical protein